MNNQRRRDIATLVQKLRSLKEDTGDLLDAFDVGGLVEDSDDLRSQETEYFDNMPESLQSGEKGEAASVAIDHLDTACESLEEFQTEITDLLDRLDEICDSLENASS